MSHEDQRQFEILNTAINEVHRHCDEADEKLAEAQSTIDVQAAMIDDLKRVIVDFIEWHD